MDAWSTPASGLQRLSTFPSQGLYHTIPEGHLEAHGCPLANRDPGRGAVETASVHSIPVTGALWAQGPSGRQPTQGDRRGSQAGSLHTDSSCLLTPPSTPLSLEPGGPSWPEPGGLCGKTLLDGQRNGPGGLPGAVLEGETWPAHDWVADSPLCLVSRSWASLSASAVSRACSLVPVQGQY